MNRGMQLRRTTRLGGFALLAAAGGALCVTIGACGDGPVAPTPETVAWAADDAPPARRHAVVLWAYDEDAARPQFAAAAKALGVTGVQCTADRDPAPFVAAGLDWYEDHSAGKGTLELREKDSKPVWDRAWAARKDAWPAADARSRPVCLRDPAVVAAMEERVRAAARRAKRGEGGRGALWISLADEAGMSVRANPGDWCLCERCIAAFRESVSFGNTSAGSPIHEQFNAACGTDYANRAAIVPWTTSGIRQREIANDPSKWNLAPWMLTRRFQDETFASAVRHLADVARAEAPGVAVGLCGTQAPSAFGGYDYARFLPGISFVEPYDIGLSLPICRDLAPRGTVIAQTVFPDTGDARLTRWKLWRGLARGADCTILWSSRDMMTATDAGAFQPTAWGAALAADLRVLSAPGGLGDRLASTSPVREGMVVVLSQDSVRARWMLDSVEDGDTWMRRFGSYESTHSTAIASREAAWRALSQRGVEFRDVAEFERKLVGPAPRVVVLPDAVALDDAAVGGLALLARGGTLVIADTQPARFDGLGRARATPGVPGCEIDAEFDGLAKRVERAAGPPVLRATAKRADGGSSPAVEIGLREGGGVRYAVCVPTWDVASSDDGSSTGDIPKTAVAVTYAFGDGKARAVRDERAGRDLGAVATWTVTTDAAEASVFSWSAR
ncbi:MAG: hypothetical protein K8T90_13265 [Planctomycetes bacterium]|nr:hypothetical protein [Planctomycetota bacterium]